MSTPAGSPRSKESAAVEAFMAQGYTRVQAIKLFYETTRKKSGFDNEPKHKVEPTQCYDAENSVKDKIETFKAAGHQDSINKFIDSEIDLDSSGGPILKVDLERRASQKEAAARRKELEARGEANSAAAPEGEGIGRREGKRGFLSSSTNPKKEVTATNATERGNRDRKQKQPSRLLQTRKPEHGSLSVSVDDESDIIEIGHTTKGLEEIDDDIDEDSPAGQQRRPRLRDPEKVKAEEDMRKRAPAQNGGGNGHAANSKPSLTPYELQEFVDESAGANKPFSPDSPFPDLGGNSRWDGSSSNSHQESPPSGMRSTKSPQSPNKSKTLLRKSSGSRLTSKELIKLSIKSTENSPSGPGIDVPQQAASPLATDSEPAPSIEHQLSGSVLNLRPLAKLDPKRFTQQGEEDEDDDDDEDYDCSFDLDGGAAARAAAAAAAAANPDQQQGKPTDAQEGHSPLSPNNRNNSSSNLSVASNTTTDSKTGQKVPRLRVAAKPTKQSAELSLEERRRIIEEGAGHGPITPHSDNEGGAAGVGTAGSESGGDASKPKTIAKNMSFSRHKSVSKLTVRASFLSGEDQTDKEALKARGILADSDDSGGEADKEKEKKDSDMEESRRRSLELAAAAGAEAGPDNEPVTGDNPAGNSRDQLKSRGSKYVFEDETTDATKAKRLGEPRGSFTSVGSGASGGSELHSFCADDVRSHTHQDGIQHRPTRMERIQRAEKQKQKEKQLAEKQRAASGKSTAQQEASQFYQEVQTLMSKGYTRDEAVLILRGPEYLKQMELEEQQHRQQHDDNNVLGNEAPPEYVPPDDGSLYSGPYPDSHHRRGAGSSSHGSHIRVPVRAEQLTGYRERDIAIMMDRGHPRDEAERIFDEIERQRQLSHSRPSGTASRGISISRTSSRDYSRSRSCGGGGYCDEDTTSNLSESVRSISNHSSSHLENDTLLMSLLLSQQKAKFGINMYDALAPEDEPYIEIYMKQGQSLDQAVLRIFEARFGRVDAVSSSPLPTVLHQQPPIITQPHQVQPHYQYYSSPPAPGQIPPMPVPSPGASVLPPSVTPVPAPTVDTSSASGRPELIRYDIADNVEAEIELLMVSGGYSRETAVKILLQKANTNKTKQQQQPPPVVVTSPTATPSLLPLQPLRQQPPPPQPPQPPQSQPTLPTPPPMTRAYSTTTPAGAGSYGGSGMVSPGGIPSTHSSSNYSLGGHSISSRGSRPRGGSGSGRDMAEDRATQVSLLLSQQEAEYGVNMQDYVAQNPNLDAEVHGMVAQGYSRHDALVAVFERNPPRRLADRSPEELARLQEEADLAEALRLSTQENQHIPGAVVVPGTSTISGNNNSTSGRTGMAGGASRVPPSPSSAAAGVSPYQQVPPTQLQPPPPQQQQYDPYGRRGSSGGPYSPGGQYYAPSPTAQHQQQMYAPPPGPQYGGDRGYYPPAPPPGGGNTGMMGNPPRGGPVGGWGGAGPSVSEDNIAMVMGMGFTRQQATQALAKHRNDVNNAVDDLLNMG